MAQQVHALDPFGQGVNTGVNDLYTAFLGPMPMSARTDPYERRNVDKWNMPENYRGKNQYLRDTVEDLLWTSNVTWYTTVIMPWEVTDDIHLQWTNLKANAHFLDTTPYQSQSALVTQERQIRRASLVRRGIAAEFEHDFLRTPLGRVSFLAALSQMSRSVQETANAEVIRALINNRSTQLQFEREHGIIRERDLKGYLARDRDRFAIAQKQKNGLEKLDLEVEKEMWAWRGKADTWILPEEVSIYAQIVPPEKTDYYLAGPLGPDRVNREGDRRLAQANTTLPQDRIEPRRMVNSTPVYVARSFHVENLGSLDLLSRTRQVGEYNTMCDENSDYSNYKSASRDIAIYSEDADDFVKISLEEAIMNCGLWDANTGALMPPRRRRGANVEEYQRDFLSLNDERGAAPIRRVYQMNPVFLTREYLRNVVSTLKATGTSQDVATLLGTDAGDINEYVRLNFSDAEYVEGGMVPVYRRVVVREERMGSNIGGTTSTDEVDQGFLQMLGASVPANKRTEIEELAQAPQQSMQDRIQAIRAKFNEYATEKARGFKLKDAEGSTEKVDAFFADRMQQYEQAKSEVRATAARVGASVRGSDAGSTERKVVKYMAPGLDLSDTEFEYKYKGSERATTGDATVDRSTYLRTLADQIYDMERSIDAASAVRGARRMADAGAGLGLEGIGALAFTEQSKRQGAKKGTTMLDEAKTLLATMRTHAGEFIGDDQAYALVYLNTPVTRDGMLNLARNDIPVPINFLLFRPHMTYKMRMAIKVARGGAAGKTYYGHSNMQIQHEAGRKIALMHYTTHMRAVVTEPRNVYVQHDVFSEEYKGGAGVKFWTPDTYRSKNNEHLQADIICVAIPPNEGVKEMPQAIDSSGRFYVEYAAGVADREDFQELHFSTAARYNALYGFYDSAKQQGADVSAFSAAYVADNRLMYQGHQFMYNTKSGEFDRVRTNKGHWGKNVYPGVGQVRAGKLTEIRQIDWTKYRTI